MKTVIHVGLMKTGTTTLQHMLAANQASLSEHGIVYPAGREFNHTTAVSELLRSDPEAQPRLTGAEVAKLRRSKTMLEGRFNLLQSVYESAAPHRVRVVSAENLVSAGPRTIRRVVSGIAGDGDVSVLVTTRRLEKLLPSNYQQQARVAPLPRFESWLRTALRRLSVSKADHPLWSLRADVLRDEWEHVHPTWHVVDMDADSFDAGLRDAWKVLAPEVAYPGVRGVEQNRGSSAEYIAALQAFLRERGGRSPTHVLRIQWLMGTRYPDLVALGRRFQVSPVLATRLRSLEQEISEADRPEAAWLAFHREVGTWSESFDGTAPLDQALVSALGDAINECDRRLIGVRIASGVRDRFF